MAWKHYSLFPYFLFSHSLFEAFLILRFSYFANPYSVILLFFKFLLHEFAIPMISYYAFLLFSDLIAITVPLLATLHWSGYLLFCHLKKCQSTEGQAQAVELTYA